MISQLEVRVRYKETDKMGRVYHSNYFVWLDMARTEYLRELGISYKEMEEEGFFFVVAETNCKYIRPLEFDDHVLIKTRIAETKKASVFFSYDLVNKEKDIVCAQANTKLVAVNGSGKVVPIPEKILKLLQESK
jgi:acyl-CoA thioester hydrolase